MSIDGRLRRSHMSVEDNQKNATTPEESNVKGSFENKATCIQSVIRRFLLHAHRIIYD